MKEITYRFLGEGRTDTGPSRYHKGVIFLILGIRMGIRSILTRTYTEKEPLEIVRHDTEIC